jgi:CP family cyanate transporter-like MFS transporter
LVGLIALLSLQLRTVVVGVAPVLPELRSDLHLSFSATGALTAIPVLGLGAGAVPGAILVNRFGARRVVGAATLGLGLAALLRLTPPLPYSLYVWTAVLSLCVAVAQPGITVLVRSWFPDRLQQVSTIYAMSLGVGGLAGATLSVYLLVLGGWRATFVIWGLVALLVAGVWIWLAPGRGTPHEPARHGLGQLIRERQVWHVAALFGCQSLVF